MSQSKDREEDSGLHDIRNLASSTKARLSSRRSTQTPVMSEDDILASSSAGWKAVALPEPAKMVSLPALADLPSAVEIESKDKAARAAAKADAKRVKSELKAPTAVEAAPVAAVEADVAPVTPIGSRIAATPSGGGKGKTIALVGTLMAAAAGVAIFMVVNKKDTSHSASAVNDSAKVAVQTPELAPPPKLKEVAPPPPPAEVTAAPIEEPVAPAPVVEEKVAVKDDKKKDKVHKVEIRDERPAVKEAAKPEKKEEPKVAAKTGDDNEPSFDALLKEAGVGEKKEAKVALEKKDLSAGDFRTGMNAITGKAKACYKGTQGTVKFKVAIASSGSVASVTTKGEFAGTPEAACVESAVKSATFPAWDGPQKSFDYSYLLSD